MQSILNIVALSIMIILPRGIDSNCELSDHGFNVYNVCVGDIKCVADTNNFNEILDDWNCRRLGEQQFYDDYGQMRTKLGDNYVINLILSDIYSTGDTFEFVSESHASHVIKIEANNVNMVLMPSQINKYIHVKDINLNNNNIETIYFSHFLELNELKAVNFSNNDISTLAVDPEDSSIHSSGVTSIDLSYNLIETIPNNYFSSYTQLEYLDLSYNFIKSFNIITFEGIMKLHTLHMSHNKLNSLGYSLTRFTNLIELNLDQNLLSSILEPTFVAMFKLQKINLSSNYIQQIDNKAFHNLANLVELDLGYNQINVITRELFTNNSELRSLSLSHNKIEQIESGAFEDNNITEFQIDNNKIMNSIEKRTFQGIYVSSFNLIKGQITSLSPEAFSAMNSTLTSLNLSSNLINNISKSSFRSLYLLTVLDLSNNKISDIDFEKNDLQNLTLFLAQNNTIQKIRKGSFSNFTSLTKLDLSFNSINDIELHSFDELKKLEVLNLNHNTLINTVAADTFHGLISLKTMDIMYTNLRSYENDAFSDTKFLNQFNSSHGLLSFIGFNIFKRCDNLMILDFSYNLLENFDINITSITGVNEIYLNNNKIRKVTNKTFTGLTSLRILHLSNNNIVDLEPQAFLGLHNLMHLFLFSNPDMEISDTAFNNLKLTDLSVGFVIKNFNFLYTTNASITNLKLQHCGIVNISTVYVYKIANVQKLNLRSNEIAILDKSSFQNMPYLVLLDLSFNKITYIQPGSFTNTNMINVLDLNWNYIQSLQYGVLDGLKNIRQLNLSNNVLHSFGANLLHNSPYIENICLDDNAIQSINFHDFIATGVKSISIGGNPIACDTLVDLKKEKFHFFNITTKVLNYNSENVDGITCRTVLNNTRDHGFFQNNNDTIRPVLVELTNIIKNLRVSVDIANNNTVTNKLLAISGLAKIMSDSRDMIAKLDETIKNETSDLRNLTKILSIFIKLSNETQILNNKYMNQLVDVHNETRYYIENMNEFIKNKTNSSEVSGKTQLMLFEEILQRNIKNERELLNSIQSIQNSFNNSSYNIKQLDGNILKDVKMVLYFISICLALILLCVVWNILYKNVVKRRLIENKMHSSCQPIANVMELE